MNNTNKMRTELLASKEVKTPNDDDDNYLLLSNEEIIARLLDGDLPKEQRNDIIKIITKNHELRRRVSDYVKFKRFKNNDEQYHNRKATSAVAKEKTNNEKVNTGQNNNRQNENTRIINEDDLSISQVEFNDDSLSELQFTYDDYENEILDRRLYERALSLYQNKIKVGLIKTKQGVVFKPVCIKHLRDEYQITGTIHRSNSTKQNLEVQITKNGKDYDGDVFLYIGETFYKKMHSNHDKNMYTDHIAKVGSYLLYIKDGDIENNIELEVQFP